MHASGGAALIAPLGSFNALGGVPAPSGLMYSADGLSVSPWFLAGIDARFLRDLPALRFGARVGLQWYGLDYAAGERVPIATEDGGVYMATLDHDLVLSFSTVGIEPYARYQLEDWLALDLGLPFQIPMGSDHTQTMRFADPPGLPFLDGSTEVTTGQGVVPGLSALVPSLSLGAEGTVPMNRTGSVQFTPRLSVIVPITAWETEAGLRTLSVNAGIGIRFQFRERPEDPYIDEQGRYLDTTIVRDTVVILSSRVVHDSLVLVSILAEQYPNGDTVNVLVRERYQRLIPKPPSVLKASLSLAFETEDGSLIDEARVNVTTVELTRTVPILPVVVFDPEGTSLPERYRQLTPAVAARWKEPAALREQQTHWQYHVLNVVGSRMRANAQTSLRLISYDDGTAEGAIANARRTAAVQTYLLTTFGLPKSRVIIENRRGQASQQPWVFLADDTRVLLKPLTVADTVVESRLPRVRMRPDVISESRLRSWVIAIRKGADTVKQMRGEGSAPGIVMWDMNEDLTTEATLTGPKMLATLTVIDREGTIQQSEPSRISVQEPSRPAQSGINERRIEVLRWIGADYLHTPDLELFGLSPSFDRIDVYPSTSRREDFFVVSAPAVVHPVSEPVWFREHLHPAEQPLFDHAEVYIKRERRP